MSKKPAVLREAIAEVTAVYADLAARPLNRDCVLRSACCHFKRTGRTPHLTRGEALLAAKGLRASGRKSLPVRTDGACPLLHPLTNRCMIYESRPFGCRTHFCEPAGGPTARRDVLDLIRRLEKVDADLDGSGPLRLQIALQQALETL